MSAKPTALHTIYFTNTPFDPYRLFNEHISVSETRRSSRRPWRREKRIQEIIRILIIDEVDVLRWDDRMMMR